MDLRRRAEQYRKDVLLVKARVIVGRIHEGVLEASSNGLGMYRHTEEIPSELVVCVEKECRRVFAGCTVGLKRDVFGVVQGVEITW